MRSLHRIAPFGLAAAFIVVACKERSTPPDDAAAPAPSASATTSAATSLEPVDADVAETSAAAPSASAAPSVGTALSACDAPGHTRCFDSKYALFCRNGKYEIIPCKGPSGCRSTAGEGSDAVCDDNVAAEGDQCLPGQPPDAGQPAAANYACTSDHKAQLVCRGNKFVKTHACRGPRGCSAWSGKVDCDASIAEVGDPCEQGASACKSDRSMMLECKGGHLAATSSCRGPKACTFNGSTHRADCDDSVATAGDPCNAANERRCTTDKKQELVCTGGKYAKKKDCTKHGCSMKGTEVTCD